MTGVGGCHPESLLCVEAQVEPAVKAVLGSAGAGGDSSTFCQPLPLPAGTIWVFGSFPAFSCKPCTPARAPALPSLAKPEKLQMSPFLSRLAASYLPKGREIYGSGHSQLCC